MPTGNSLASGLRALPDTRTAFASTQAAWRFWHNDEVSLKRLIGPLLEEARTGLAEACDAFGLVMHDWSRLNYGGHERKKDRLQMTHATDIGYELQSALLVSDRDGQPMAPVVQNLTTNQGVLSTYGDIKEKTAHLDELTQRMHWLEAQDWERPLVHVIDREADSVGHMRQWQSWRWLVRVKEGNRVDYAGRSQKIEDVSRLLTFKPFQTIEVKGGKCVLHVGEAQVVLSRPAKPKRQENGKRQTEPGAALSLRLVACKAVGEDGQELLRWHLLSNVEEVEAERLACWYYWRWKIESFFKLLKGGGHQVEEWQQETGEAIAKRLLVASMACVLVWKLQRAQGQEAEAFRRFLVRLSGRQMTRKKPVTDSALLAGLWSFLSMLEVMKTLPPDLLRQWGKSFLNKT